MGQKTKQGVVFQMRDQYPSQTKYLFQVFFVISEQNLTSKNRLKKGMEQKNNLLTVISQTQKIFLGPNLKSCSFLIHRLDEIKNSNESLVGRNFFFAFSLSKKIYTGLARNGERSCTPQHASKIILGVLL